jgi:hypothetical protein
MKTNAAHTTVAEASGVHEVPKAPKKGRGPDKKPRMRHAFVQPLAREVVPVTLGTGVVTQVRTAFSSQNRLAMVLGFFLAALVPVAIFTVAHVELDWTLSVWEQPKSLLVAGGLVFSAKTVYQWARLAFDDWMKALGFVILVEGVMVCSSTRWLSIAALVYLVVINGIATGCQLTKK